jgi:hypothetical protein
VIGARSFAHPAWLAVLTGALLTGCPATSDDDDTSSPNDDDATAAPDDDDATPTNGVHDVGVTVTVDGVPEAGVHVRQGGASTEVLTDADGAATVSVNFDVDAELWLIASHSESRQGVVGVPEVWLDDGALTIELERFDPSDNEAYVFRDPGEPDRRESTNQCAHCHVTINEAWFETPHQKAAKNPVVHDVYAGTAAALDDTECVDAGGEYWLGIGPGTGEDAWRCYVGSGTLPDLNDNCGDDGPCDGIAAATGACADCHAPGIDGVLGGRDLLEATDHAYEYGVHCDTCHKVESVDLTADAGVAGRLHVVRPSEEFSVLPFKPMYFGPYHDVGNPFMGAVQRDHFLDATICAGCHELDQPSLVSTALDTARWPSGTLPIHSTYSEWVETPLNPALPCQGCHMPTDSTVTNSADLQLLDVGVGIATGWPRPPGSVAQHIWDGPRNDASTLLALAASLKVESTTDAGVQTVSVSVSNVGAGHAIPTGEPMRALVLTVEGGCGDNTLKAIGGHSIPDVGGALDRRDSTEDWSVWPGASAGDVVRVVALAGGHHDYAGHGRFGDGSFDAEAKGMPIEEVVGFSTIDSVNGDAVTFDEPLPAGDVAYRGDGRARAGAAGFAFARVLADADGLRMVPHHKAVDVVSDNRIPAGATWTSTHQFEATCADPTASAWLTHRPYPETLRRERGWEDRDQVIATFP